VNIKSVGWGFGKCNMRCDNCYHASCEQAPECSPRTLKKIADKICSLVSDINYGTGEFLYNSSALELAEYISHQYPDIKQAVTTNGFTPALMESEKIKLFHDIDVSLDFPDPESHNRARRHPQAWNWTIRTLEICRSLGKEASITTCVTSQTTDKDILEFLELARKYKTSWRASWFRQTGRGKSEKRLSAARFWEIIRLLAKNAVFESLSDPLLEAIFGKGKCQGCSCGKSSCRIQTDLSVTPCVFLKGKKWSGGSLLRAGLEQIYASNSFARLREREPKTCLSCAFWEKCRGGCASRAFLHNGSINQSDDYCPVAASLPEKEWRGIDVTVEETTGKVHSGYLCTLIVKPK
jgi:radical SAM protein with 4Fe4S-binding SPASM domain